MSARRSHAAIDPDEERVVTWQLGRPLRGPWRVAVRCTFGYPQVVETHPVLDSGELFPTLFYLTCPCLRQAASDAESTGALAQFDSRVREDAGLAARMRAVHAEVGELRAKVNEGVDPCAGAGVAGQADPLATKCLHARAAAALAGIQDPAGQWLLDRSGTRCDDGRCGRRDEHER